MRASRRRHRRRQSFAGRPDRAARARRAPAPGFGRDDALGLRVVEAGRDALDRRLGVEGDPGRAGARDRDLRDQQIDAARHPQTDHVAGADAGERQSARLPARKRPDLGIAQPADAIDERRMLRPRRNGGGEDLGQNLVPMRSGLISPTSMPKGAAPAISTAGLMLISFMTPR